MDARKVGRRIQEARLESKMTQSELSQIVNLTPKYISNIECGAKNPKLETFVAIANALKVDANTLLVDVLDVSDEIVCSELSEKLAKVSESSRQKVLRMINALLEVE